MKKRKRKTAQVRHIFYTAILNEVTGKEIIVPHPVKVRYATKEAVLKLEIDHVERSIKLDGVGDLVKCTMAICGHANAKAFSHSLAESGWLDWTYSRVFVASKDSKKNSLPIECYCYEHNDDIAHLNDSPGGQQKLLERIRAEGPIYITLKPYRIRSKKGRSGKGRPKTGTRAPLKTYLKGAKLRRAMARIGDAR
jgi:hypothetical protein